MAKATKTIKQALSYRSVHAAWFAATQTLFNQVAAFYFEVIQAHPDVTGIIAEGEQDNAALWAKIRAIDEDTAHQVSHRIIQFAQAHGASILVFEHLAYFKPQKGKYSKRGNEKRSYWLKGRIFKYARYQAWNEQIVTCRVNAKNTSRQCARCQRPVARYNAGQPAEGYTPGASLVWCSNCQMRGNADRNASMVIGQRLLVRYQTNSQEKPHTPLHAERSAKAGGVSGSQVAKRRRRPSTNQARQGAGNAQGTAHDMSAGMAADASGIPHPLRVRRIGGEEGAQQKLLELMEGSMHTSLTPNLERGGRPEHARKAA